MSLFGYLFSIALEEQLKFYQEYDADKKAAKDGLIASQLLADNSSSAMPRLSKAMLNKYPNNDITFDKSLIHKEVKFTSRT